MALLGAGIWLLSEESKKLQEEIDHLESKKVTHQGKMDEIQELIEEKKARLVELQEKV